jgi:tRNA dimethylallyltransferase
MKIFIISGATATGKTQASLEIASKLGGEIINFDSVCLYRELNIGTAKPNKEEQTKIPHHLIDVISAKQSLNASDYRNLAIKKIEELKAKSKPIFLVGGSGFYLQAVMKGMYDSPSTPKDILEKSQLMYEQQGILPFLEVLKEYDLDSLNRYHQNDHYRIRRAVEHWWTHQTPFSKKRTEHKSFAPEDWNFFHAYMDIPKEEHWPIIQKRTQDMFKMGWIDEVKNLLHDGFTGHEKPLQCVGYKQILEFLKEEKKLSECEEQINIATRQLAKSQRTWFNREAKHSFHPLRDKMKLISQAEEFFKD